MHRIENRIGGRKEGGEGEGDDYGGRKEGKWRRRLKLIGRLSGRKKEG